MDPYCKLFIARTTLSLKQHEAATLAGINLPDVGALERGDKKCIPNEYLAFLYKKGIDINWIFSNKDIATAPVFRDKPGTALYGSNLQFALKTIEDKLNSLCHYESL